MSTVHHVACFTLECSIRPNERGFQCAGWAPRALWGHRRLVPEVMLEDVPSVQSK